MAGGVDNGLQTSSKKKHTERNPYLAASPGGAHFFKFHPNGDVMSTEQIDTKTYDVIFVARKNTENKNAGMIAENVDKATAIRFAQRYCHRNEDNEGVMIAYHGTTIQPEGSEWWFH